MQKILPIGLGAGAAILIGVLVAMGAFRAPAPNTAVSNAEDVAIRSVIGELGSKFKNVSLLAPDASVQISAQYSRYITPKLLALWQAKPENAPGRQTSSPWPDRIEITTVTHKEVSATAKGNVVEVTNADTRDFAAMYPVVITLEKRDNVWLVSDWQKGPVQTPPERITVVGYWECLPHKDRTGPQTDECALGIAIDASDGHYGLNTSLMATYPVDFSTGSKVRVSGVLQPVESNTRYDIDGTIWATAIERI